MPIAREVIEGVAVRHDVCIHPVPLRRIDPRSGETVVIDVPCGATLASKCPPCAERARLLRMAQCRIGWHLDEEPLPPPEDPSDEQLELATVRADLEAARQQLLSDGSSTAQVDLAIERVEEELAKTGVRGSIPAADRPRRARSTSRRQDVAELPRRTMMPTTLGRTFTAPDGRVYRPSIFLTVTLPSYGPVDKDGVPRDFERYDFRAAARDAIHFAKVNDRLFQNIRRVVGYDVQYFGAVEPQRRLAPHLHLLLRGTMPRKELKQIVAATYHQVWWPSTDEIRYTGTDLPSWDEAHAGYVDPATGALLPTWDEALDAIASDDGAEPSHVVRFGKQVDIQGVLGGSPQAERRINYVVKYLSKSIDSCHEAVTLGQQEHMRRLWEALRYEPCSPTCANWLRYGVQPKHARPGLEPGFCKGKAHRHETLGFGGRRVLVSRKWSGKTLEEHRRDRREWVRDLLGLPDDPDPNQYLWMPVSPSDPDVRPREQRLLLAIADRARWRAQLQVAKDAAVGIEPAAA